MTYRPQPQKTPPPVIDRTVQHGDHEVIYPRNSLAAKVLRRADGAVVGRFDPCPACRYADPAFSPDGKSLVFVASDPKTRHAALMRVDGGVLSVATAFDGLLAPDFEVLMTARGRVYRFPSARLSSDRAR